MARKVIWTANAQSERLQVLTYWAERNGSFRYSEKLDGMFRTALRLIAVHTKLGRATSDPDVRVKEVGDHKIFYRTTASEVHVLSVWHGSRDPASQPF